MTDLAPSLTAADPSTLGQAAASGLAAVPGLAVEPLGPDDGVPAPGDECAAVAVDLEGGARIVMLASKAVTRQVQVGPPPAEDVVDGCSAALAAVAAAVGAQIVGGPSEVGQLRANPDAGEVAIAARLLDAGTHAATIALVMAAPAAGEEQVADDAAIHEFAPLGAGAGTSALGHTGLELLHDVSLGVTAELGRTRMLVRDVLSLAPGAVIELDRAAGSPVDVLVNGTLIARGEVVVIDEEFGIRITEVIGYAEGNGRA